MDARAGYAPRQCNNVGCARLRHFDSEYSFAFISRQHSRPSLWSASAASSLHDKEVHTRIRAQPVKILWFTVEDADKGAPDVEQREIIKKSLSRRNFLLGAAGAAGTAILAACGGSATSTPAPAATTASGAATTAATKAPAATTSGARLPLQPPRRWSATACAPCARPSM